MKQQQKSDSRILLEDVVTMGEIIYPDAAPPICYVSVLKCYKIKIQNVVLNPSILSVGFVFVFL